MKFNNKQIIITGLFVALLIFIIPEINNWYDNNWRDHTETLKKVGEPLKEYVLEFHKENQRYPSFDELIASLIKMDCNNIKQKKYKNVKDRNGEIYYRRAEYDCDYGSITLELYLSVSVDVFTSNNGDRSYMENLPVQISFYRGNSRCNYFKQTYGTSKNSHSCHTDKRLINNWSH